MKQYLILILIASHLYSSSVYSTKTFLDIEHIHNDIHKCYVYEHQHNHSHNTSHHQHKHSHVQININYADLFTSTYYINFYDFDSPKQTYLEIYSWIPNPTLDTLFRPPKA